MPHDVELTVSGKPVKVSNLDKVLYPATGFTKGQVIDYYIKIAPVLLPHLSSHPVTMKRYPNGVHEAFFYEKRCPIYRPAWVTTAKPRASRSERGDVSYCMVDGLPALVWTANLASLEFHTLLSGPDNAQTPTAMVFDLDPGPPASMRECAWLGLRLREALASIRLQSFAKTSGGKGLHVYVPLNTAVTFDQTKALARGIAELLTREHPERVTSIMRKSERGGKVFVDWSQNDEHKTTVCPYSLRAKEQPSVSMPVTWEEVERAAKKPGSRGLVFGPDDALRRVKQHGDLFAPVLSLRQRLPASKAGR